MSVSQSLLVATRNKDKLKELRQLLRDLPLAVCDLAALPAVETVQETGNTFVENASLKATGYASQAHLLTLADDSGLIVDALGGAPGVLSARYGGASASDEERIAKLLTELSTVQAPNRTARFVSEIAIADRDGTILSVFSGTCEGQIAFAPSGRGGFGYDPIFIPASFQKTFAELKPQIKNRISHRARAFSEARKFLRTLTIASGGR